jgi:hypothetical protein
LLIPIIGAVIGLVAIPRAYSTLTNGIGGKGLNPDRLEAIKAQAASASAPIGAASATQDRSILAKLQDVVKPPKVAGCMATVTRCSCLDTDGRRADFVSEYECRIAAVELGGLISYDNERRAQVSATPMAFSAIPALAKAPSPSAVGIDAGDIRDRDKRTIVRGSGPGGMGTTN